MKQFFTSYYAKKGNDPLAVSISAKPPPYFTGKWYVKLAPTWAMVNGVKKGDWSEEDYVRAYYKKLQTIDPFEVVNELIDGSFLLCYEVPTDFCHRHIVAEWIQKETGIVVREWHEEPVKSPAAGLLVF